MLIVLIHILLQSGGNLKNSNFSKFWHTLYNPLYFYKMKKSKFYSRLYLFSMLYINDLE